MSKPTAEVERTAADEQKAVPCVGEVERRRGDRRKHPTDRRTGLERRRGPGRRKSDERRAAEEGEMTDEQFEFIMAIDTYKRVNKRPFPTWTEVLEIIKALGYRRVAEPTPLDRRVTDELDLFFDE